MIGQLPEPNTSDAGDGLNTSGYRFNPRNNESRNQFVYKGDYYLTSKHSFTGTYNYINNPTDRPDAGSLLHDRSAGEQYHQGQPAVALLALDGFRNTHQRAARRLHALGHVFSGQQPVSVVDPQRAGNGSADFSNPVNTFLNQGRKVNTYNIQDNANWLKGKHELSFGFQSQMLRVAPVQRRRHYPDLYSGHQHREHCRA